MIEISKYSPFIILLDLDETIQGDVSPQLVEYNLIEKMKKTVDGCSKLKQDKSHLYTDFNDGLLRPNFKRFIVKMQKRFPNVEFFVYTASEDKWAQYIVKHIIQHSLIKINTKVFTREHCILDYDSKKYMKSISHVTPLIFNILKKKYNLVTTPKYQFKHIYLIDNNFVLYDNEKHHLIKCHDYKKSVIIDQTRNIPKHIIQKEFQLLSTFLLHRNSNSYFEFYENYYRLLNYSNQKEKFQRIIYRKDSFWVNILRWFKNNFKLV